MKKTKKLDAIKPSKAANGAAKAANGVSKAKKAKSLPKDQLNFFKKMLEEKKADLVHEVDKRLQEGQNQERVEVMDSADQASDSYESELHFGINDAERKLLEEVEEALERIRAGSFGVCASCGTAISMVRLKAMPSARLCITCKQSQERARIVG